jgi:hypothetical protein
MKKYILMGLIAIIAAGITGCLLTSQITIVEDIDVGETTSDSVGMYWLDLNVNEDYLEHKDKIKSVDAISLVAWIYNDTSTTVFAEIWVDTDTTYDYSNPDTIKAHATRVFASPEIPGYDSLLIDWNDSFQYMERVDYLGNLIMDVGTFAIYGLASDVPFKIRIIGQIVVTLTVGS